MIGLTQQWLVCPQVSRQNDSEGSWVSLDVRKLLEYWFQSPSENLGLVVQATGPPDPLGRSLIVTDLAEANGAMVSKNKYYHFKTRRHLYFKINTIQKLIFLVVYFNVLLVLRTGWQMWEREFVNICLINGETDNNYY